MSIDIPNLPRNQKTTGWIDVANRPDGGTWRLPYLSVTGETDGPTLVVVAGVHGDEYEGVETIPRVYEHLDSASLKGTFFAIPVCNVPAYETITRSSPIDGLNLARVFPGDADGSITQRIARLITDQILPHADFFIDLHSGGMAYDIPTLVGYIHNDTPLGHKSQAGARAFATPVLWGHPGLAPGRTLSAAVDHDVPCLYTEAPGGGFARTDDIECFYDGVMNVAKWLGMLEGEPNPSPATHHLIGDGNMDEATLAPVAGYFRADVSLLDEVTSGQRIGTIRNLFGEIVTEICAKTDGVVIMLRRFHNVRVGDGLAHITKHYREA